MKWCRVFVFLAVLIPSRVLGVPVGQQPSRGQGPVCRRAVSPANGSRGVNRVAPDNWDPLFKLDLSTSGHHEYRVSIQLGSRFLPFSDAFISAETNGSCGVGELVYHSHDFFRVEQEDVDCPLLLTTNRKSVMHRLPPLRWKAPQCGCVHFRAMVLEASTIYYAEQDGVLSGPLATTVCVGHSGHNHHHVKKMSLEERTELLCRVTERFSGLEVHQRPEFLRRRRLEPSYMDAQVLELALSTRRHDIRLCCAKTGQEGKKECFSDIRRRRVDGFCKDGSPDVPFTVSRSRFMRQREDACCWRLGEARYDCFAEKSATAHGEYSADFSLDETNPLNDISDHPHEIQDLEKVYGMALFPWDKANPDQTYAYTTTTRTTTTTTTTPSPLPVGFPPAPARWGGGGARAGQMRGGGWSREASTMKKNPVVAVQEEFAGGFSREVFREQQGGSSIDKTFSKLQRRMWKVALKTQCCEAGVSTASATYGDFRAVWSQCNHGAGKYLHAQRMRRGHKICTTQFRRCCMEMAISTPSEVVTWKPETASSTEWDRDHHLVNKLYFPPYARPSTLPGAISARRRSGPLLPGRGGASAALRLPPGVDEPEIDEEPQQANAKDRRRPRKPSSAAAKRFNRKFSSREMEVEEDDDDVFDEAETAVGRRQRRMRKLNAMRRFEASGSRRRASTDLDLVDDPEIDGEEPSSKKRRMMMRKMTRPRSGGISGRRRVTKSRQQKKRRRQPNRHRSRSSERPQHAASPRRTLAGHRLPERKAIVAASLPRAKTVAAAERQRRLKAEEEGLREIFALIAEDVDEGADEVRERKKDAAVAAVADPESDLDEDTDSAEEGSDKDDDEEDEISSDGDRNDEEKVRDKDETTQSSHSDARNEAASAQDWQKGGVNVQGTQAETKPESSSTPQTPKASKETEKAPEGDNKAKPVASSASANSRQRPLRANLRDLSSEEYYHSEARSGGRSRHHRRRHHHGGRRKHNRKFRPGQRRRNLPTSRELRDGLEED